MKKTVHAFAALVTLLFFLGETAINAQTLVSQWGKTSLGTGWPILNTAATPAGTGSFGAAGPPPSWATIRGEFPTVTPTTSSAIVVSGKFAYIGGGTGDSYVGLRYALTFQDSTTLNYANTDSAMWVSSKKHYGYEFTPRSAATDMANGSGGAGTVWTVNNGSWTSTWSNGGKPIIAVKQAPFLASLTEGVYDWAISVRPLADGTNEIKWYFIKQAAAGQQTTYWFGGTVIDSQHVATKFNGICFGVGNGITTTLKQVDVTNVTVTTGSPITVPDAPFQAFYVNKWGATPQGKGWPILNDSTFIDGNASMGGDAPPASWATIRGEFDGGFKEPVTPTLKKAIVVTGKLEYTPEGPNASYVSLRYALTFQDSTTLVDQNKTTANWTSTKPHYGYEFTPRAGATDMANGGGGSGTVWTVNGGNGWNSTWSNNGGPIASVKQAPYLAEITGGVYDWAISVQPLADGSNEIKWYLIKEAAAGKQTAYWFGGTVIDKVPITKKFNGVAFGVGNGITTNMKQFNLIDVKVDLGDPIVVPDAPFEAFYVNKWGATPQGKGWPVLNDSTYIDGNASMGADGPPASWATIRGEFNGGFKEPVTPTLKKAIVVTGKLEYTPEGPGASYVSLRYALTFQDSTTLVDQNKPTANWTSTKPHYGYEFTPKSGATDMANGGGGSGVVWTVNGGNGWNSTWSNNGGPLIALQQAPFLAEISGGVYNWAISVQPLADGSNEVRWYLVKQAEAGKQTDYWFAGTVIDKIPVTKKFNGVAFGVGNGITTKMKQFNLLDVKVDLGDPITLPKKPFQSYYVQDFGFYGNRYGGWQYTAGEVDGNATISGAAAMAQDDWAVLRAAFSEPIGGVNKDTALVVTGKLEFVGGGFEAPNSLYLGLFNTSGAGSLVKTPVESTHWSGNDKTNSGYLLVPPSGKPVPMLWAGNALGNFGAVVNRPWSSVVGDANYAFGTMNQKPANAIASAGTYDFLIAVAPQGNGTSELKYRIAKSDNSYVWEARVIDSHKPVASDLFNSFGVAFGGGNKTTKVNIVDLKVDLAPTSSIPVDVEQPGEIATVPTSYTLNQNYPNPFNPTTTIEFGLPETGKVRLEVYDMLGRVVSTLVDSEMKAGYHKVNFNAANLASGVYFYSIKSGDFTSVKKLVLLK